MTLITHLPLASWKKCATLLGVALLAPALAACEHLDPADSLAGGSLIEPTTVEERHPIVVTEEPSTMRVRVTSGARGLSPAQRNEILAFANRSGLGRGSNTRVFIRAPGGSVNEDAAMELVADIRDLLASQGTPDSSVIVEAYHAAEQHDAPIRLSVMRYVAQGPHCGDWPENLANNRENVNYHNFGCSAQKNMAAMVANPADLQGPRSMDGRPAERRDGQWGKYLKGETTNADKGDDEKMSVKNSVAN